MSLRERRKPPNNKEMRREEKPTTRRGNEWMNEWMNETASEWMVANGKNPFITLARQQISEAQKWI